MTNCSLPCVLCSLHVSSRVCSAFCSCNLQCNSAMQCIPQLNC